MPTYSFRNKETGELSEHVMKMSELDAFKESHPELERYMNDIPGLADPVRLGRVKIDNGFREVLHRISERAPGAKGLKDSIR